MLPLVQGLKTVASCILSRAFANAWLLVAVDQCCVCGPSHHCAEWGGRGRGDRAVVLKPVSLSTSHGTLLLNILSCGPLQTCLVSPGDLASVFNHFP